jgi:hypothetical protein
MLTPTSRGRRSTNNPMHAEGKKQKDKLLFDCKVFIFLFLIYISFTSIFLLMVLKLIYHYRIIKMIIQIKYDYKKM